MKKLIDDRRLFISFISVAGLLALAWFKSADVGYHVVSICAIVAGSNAIQAIKK
jgi:hypothetical protein